MSSDVVADCSGLQEGGYYFRLVTSVFGYAEYNLINAVNDATYLTKRSFKNVSFIGEKLSVVNNLSQNYPKSIQSNYYYKLSNTKTRIYYSKSF